MFGTIIKFFKFCDKENRRKFTGSIFVGILNSLFMALRIAAVAVMLRGVIATALEGATFETKTIWLSFAIMCVSIIGGIITRKITAMWQCEGGYRTCAKKRNCRAPALSSNGVFQRKQPWRNYICYNKHNGKCR